MQITRGRAWQTVDAVLKHRAESYSSGATMSKYVADQFNALAKFEVKASKNPPSTKKYALFLHPAVVYPPPPNTQLTWPFCKPEKTDDAGTKILLNFKINKIRYRKQRQEGVV